MLFVSGMSPNSSFAIGNIKRICDTYLAGNYELQIIDIARDKQLAVAHQIVGIPTLMKIYPEPRKTILGDLSDTQKVLNILDLI